MTPIRGLLLTLGACLFAAAPLLAAPPKPVGNWKREAAEFKATVAVTETTMTVKADFKLDDHPYKIVIDAEYSVTTDGVVYGVISCVDGSPLDVVTGLRLLDGQPFAMRCKVDDKVMFVRDVKFLGAEIPSKDSTHAFGEVVSALAGRYEADEAPRPMPATKPTPKPVTRDVRIPAPVVEIPAPQASIAPTQAPVIRFIPTELPPVSSAMPSVPPHIISQWERDSGGPAIQRVGIDFNAVPTQTPAPVAAARPIPPLQGAWVREVPGVRTTLTLTDRRLKADVEYAVEDRKEVQRGTIHVDADCAVSPDGLVFGVVNVLDGAMPDDAPQKHIDQLPTMAAVLTKVNGAMFKFRFRCEDAGMSVHELKMVVPGGSNSEEMEQFLLMAFAGRYKKATAATRPPVKPGKVFCPAGGNCQPPPTLLNAPTYGDAPTLSPGSGPYISPYVPLVPPEPRAILYELAPRPRPLSDLR